MDISPHITNSTTKVKKIQRVLKQHYKIQVCLHQQKQQSKINQLFFVYLSAKFYFSKEVTRVTRILILQCLLTNNLKPLAKFTFVQTLLYLFQSLFANASKLLSFDPIYSPKSPWQVSHLIWQNYSFLGQLHHHHSNQ